MNKLLEIAAGCIREAADDYVGLWQISTRIRRELGVTSNEQVKSLSLDVVRLLVPRGLSPGDYLRTGFAFWPEADADAIIGRIDKEWNPSRGDPTLADPICWFALQ